MKKRIFTLATIVALAGSVTFTSCIGPFNLSNKVLNWNNGIGGKFVNEVVFIAFWIIPVYEICMFADVIVFNSIEFWTGNNPIAAGTVTEVEGENGNYTVETLQNGYHITNDKGQEMELIYDEDSNVWSSVIGDEETKLVQIEEDHAVVFLPNGEQKNVALDANGLMAFRQYAESTMFLAAK